MFIKFWYILFKDVLNFYCKKKGRGRIFFKKMFLVREIVGVN